MGDKPVTTCTQELTAVHHPKPGTVSGRELPATAICKGCGEPITLTNLDSEWTVARGELSARA
jgi:hypothetical protein